MISMRRRSKKKNPPGDSSEKTHQRPAKNPYEEFARRHPVGSLIEATVRWTSNEISLRLDEGVYARIPIGLYGDRLPNRKRPDLAFFPIPRKLEVIVCSVTPEDHNVMVSMHVYENDSKFCNYKSGYRSNYDTTEGLLKDYLDEWNPWEPRREARLRDWKHPTTHEQRRPLPNRSNVGLFDELQSDYLDEYYYSDEWWEDIIALSFKTHCQR